MFKSIALVTLIFSGNLLAETIGYSTSPLSTNKKLITGGFTGDLSSNGGVGFEGRFTHKMNELANYDIGLGISGGSRSAKIFAGYDYELFPDYQNQPRVSTKFIFENLKINEERQNRLSVAPTLSKGISVSGHELFPFIALPVGLALNNNNTYDTSFAANVGATGQLPFEGYQEVKGNIETSFNITGGFTTILLGVTYSL